MAGRMAADRDTSSALRRAALSQAGVEEAIACAGTALESASFKARGKAFLFVGARDARLKLGASLDEAAGLSSAHSSWIKVGAHGWVTIVLAEPSPVPASVLQRWVEESREIVSGGSPAKRGGARGGSRRKA